MGRSHSGRVHDVSQLSPEEEAHELEEARLRGENRAEMMRRTMGRIGGNVHATFDDVGHRVGQSFGWEQPGAPPMASTAFSNWSAGVRMPGMPHLPQMQMPAGLDTSHLPQSGQLPRVPQMRMQTFPGLPRVGFGGPSGEQGPGAMNRSISARASHSTLSPTAPEFVPHLHREGSGLFVGYEPQQGEHGQSMTGETWWPGQLCDAMKEERTDQGGVAESGDARTYSLQGSMEG